MGRLWNSVEYSNQRSDKKAMILQAIASTGAYADLWSHLKSMTHALERARKAQSLKDIADLESAGIRHVDFEKVRRLLGE